MTLDALFEKLKHPNPNLRGKAMWAIPEASDENTIPRLISIVNQDDVSDRVGGPVKFTGPQQISGNMAARCNNCPSNGCKNCPMYGVGKNPEYEKKEKLRQERAAKRQLQKQREMEQKSADL